MSKQRRKSGTERDMLMLLQNNMQLSCAAVAAVVALKHKIPDECVSPAIHRDLLAYSSAKSGCVRCNATKQLDEAVNHCTPSDSEVERAAIDEAMVRE